MWSKSNAVEKYSSDGRQIRSLPISSYSWFLACVLFAQLVLSIFVTLSQKVRHAKIQWFENCIVPNIPTI
jgi:hypothetical protein